MFTMKKSSKVFRIKELWLSRGLALSIWTMTWLSWTNGYDCGLEDIDGYGAGLCSFVCNVHNL